MIEPNQIKFCELCDLKGENYALSRIHRGSGPKVMIIGEAPGKYEAIKHTSFIGDSGQLLDRWIKKMELDNYFITNVVKHRPIAYVNGREKNGTPNLIEVSACLPYLIAEIEVENPDFIITLGKTARDALIDTDKSMTESVRISMINPYEYKGHELFILFHPSFILRKGYDMDPYLNRIKEIVKLGVE